MWNEVLKRIDSVVTPQEAIKRWGGSPNTLTLVSDGINLVYRFENNQRGLYLRMTHASLRKESELLSAIHYQNHLFQHQAPVCEPLPSLNGLWVENIIQDEDIFLAHVCSEVPGTPIHFDYPGNELYREWGKALGKLHLAVVSYEPLTHQYTNWKSSIIEMNDYAKHESMALQAVLKDVSIYFTNRSQTSDNLGLTHGDHREGNVLSDGHHVHIIDFDLPSFNWFMEDFTRPFFHSIIHDDVSWKQKITPYLEGYLSIMPKQSLDLSAFVKQIQMKSLEIYLWTKNNWSGDTAPGTGSTKQWLDKIHEKIIDTSWMQQIDYRYKDE